MGRFWNVLFLAIISLGMMSCEQADFYKKPELISSDFKDRYYPTDEEIPFDIGDNQGNSTTTDGSSDNSINTDGNSSTGTNVVDNDNTNTNGNSDATTDGNTDVTIDGGSNGNTDNNTPVVTLVNQSELFQQAAHQKSKVDILWVVDNSGSMGDEQNSLAYNFDIFINEFIKQDVDFKMGITTTDARASYIGKDYRNASQFLTRENASTNEQKFINDFKSFIKVGTRGSGKEMGLKTMEAYLTANHIANGSAFLREDAYLAVVVLSDEEEQSKQNAQHYVDFLKNIKHHDGWAKVYSIITTKAEARWETIGEKYAEVSEKTNGQVKNIKDDFYETLQNMGDSIVELTKSFALGQNPYDPSEIKVYVENVLVSNWSYDSDLNAIVFDEASLPSAGSEIRVDFQVEQ